MSNLHQLNANQIASKWVGFLRDCSVAGDDIVYSETKTTGGTWDAVKDKMVGGGTTTTTVTYVKAAVATPVRFDEGSTRDGLGSALVLGHKLGDVNTGESYIGRIKSEVPLTKTGTYEIGGMTYKFSRLIDSMRVGKRTFWNLVHFVRA